MSEQNHGAVEVDTTWTGLAGVVPSQQHGPVALASNFRSVDPHVRGTVHIM